MGSSQFAGCCKLPHRATGAGFNKETALGCAASAANQMKNVAAIFNGGVARQLAGVWHRQSLEADAPRGLAHCPLHSATLDA